MSEIAAVIATLKGHLGRQMTGEEIFAECTDVGDKNALYQALTRYARPPFNLLKREKRVGEVHYRYWLEPEAKVPTNLEDALLRREAELRRRDQAAADTTVEKRKSSESTAPQAPPIASATSAPPGKSTESEHRLPGQPAVPPIKAPDTADAYQVVLLDMALRVKRMVTERDELEMQISVAQAKRTELMGTIAQVEAAAEALRAIQ